MKNKKQSRVKIVLPVLFTFGASLLFFQADAQADSSQSADANAQVVATTDANTQNNNYQSLNISTSQNSAQAQAYTQSAVAASQNTSNSSVNDDGAVSLDNSAVQAAANKPVVETNPGYSTSQYNVTAEPVNAANGGSGAASLNTAGLTAAQKTFLDSIHDGAISTWKQYGVLPSLTAAQAIIESGWGQSSLASQYHNLFGIKGSYNGHSVTLPTREVYGGQSVIINDAFRAYDNNSQSVQDHGYFLVANSRYHNLLWRTNYRDVTYLIRADGYATDPSYTTTLNSVIERYGLTAWDQEAFDINTGNIDELDVQGDQLHIRGWHATNEYNTNMHHYIILLDGNGNELYRTEVNGAYRQDVQNAYSNATISGWGGFDFYIPYTSTFAGKNIQVVSRYTYDGHGDPNGGKDIYFTPVSLNANIASLDDMSLNAKTGTINISGWHAADASLGKKYHYIIIYDGSKQTELSRFLVKNSTRSDVAQVNPGIYNSTQSGFSLKLNFDPALAGDQIQIISRYSDSQDGEGNFIDYRFAPKTFTANTGWLDNFTIRNNQLHISGWHAADQSVGKKYHYVILYDATTHKEITRKLVKNNMRSDVAEAQPNIYQSANSGFKIDLPLTGEMIGDQIQVISRYTDDVNGNGNYTDYWFAPQTFNKNQAVLDNVTVSENQITARGWHVADQSFMMPNHFIILYDQTTHQEIKRFLVSPVQREDVAKAYSASYNAAQSGFEFKTHLDSSLNGHQIQIISRYSDTKSGQGHYIDYWFKPINVTIK